MQKPSIPKGTRDFSPAEMMRRNYIFDSIRQVFPASISTIFLVLFSAERLIWNQ